MSSPRADTQPETHRFQWQCIEIEATYTPLKWGVIALLEIRSVHPERARLPISDTGYLSHFHIPGTIEAHGGNVAAQVIAWPDEAATSLDWQRYIEASQQGELF